MTAAQDTGTFPEHQVLPTAQPPAMWHSRAGAQLTPDGGVQCTSAPTPALLDQKPWGCGPGPRVLKALPERRQHTLPTPSPEKRLRTAELVRETRGEGQGEAGPSVLSFYTSRSWRNTAWISTREMARGGGGTQPCSTSAPCAPGSGDPRPTCPAPAATRGRQPKAHADFGGARTRDTCPPGLLAHFGLHSARSPGKATQSP